MLNYQQNFEDWIKHFNLKRTSSNSAAGPCPFCGGDDRFHVSKKDGKVLVGCRKCMDNAPKEKRTQKYFEMIKMMKNNASSPLHNRASAIQSQANGQAHEPSACTIAQKQGSHKGQGTLQMSKSPESKVTAEWIALRRQGSFEKSGSGFLIPCPCCDKEKENLHCYIADGDKGGIVAKCWAKGCSFESIMDALKLSRIEMGYQVSYPNREGKDRHVYRIDEPDGTKKIWGKGGSAGCELLAWPPQCLTLHDPGSTLVIVEGEKAAQAFQNAAIEGYTAVSWKGGTGGVKEIDFNLCRGRKVFLWPDNDQPGLKVMRTAKNKALQAGAASVHTLDTRDLPQKADAADLTPEKIGARLAMVVPDKEENHSFVTDCNSTRVLPKEGKDDVISKAAKALAQKGRVMALHDGWYVREEGSLWKEIEVRRVDRALNLEAKGLDEPYGIEPGLEKHARKLLDDYTRPAIDMELPSRIKDNDRARNLRLDTGKAIEGAVFKDEVVWLDKNGQLGRREIDKKIDFVLTCRPYRLPTMEKASLDDTPHFARYLKTSFGDREKEISLALEYGGRVLLGYTSDQKFLLLQGPGRSGKGSYIRLLELLVGEGQHTAFSTIEELGMRFQASRLEGKGLATIGDMTDKPRSRQRHDAWTKGAALLKAITGEDSVTIEAKYKPPKAAALPVSFICATNYSPQFLTTGADSTAWAERMLILRFPHVVPKSERKPQIEQRIFEREGPLIARLMIHYFLESQNRRGYTLPDSHTREMNGLVRDAMTTVEQFVADCVEFVEDGTAIAWRHEIREKLNDWDKDEVIADGNNLKRVYNFIRSQCKGEKRSSKDRGFKGVKLIMHQT